MALFAIPVIIGPEGLSEWAFDNQDAYNQAREEEKQFIAILQEKLSKQLAYSLEFDERLTGIKSDSELEELNVMKLPIGTNDGILWLKDSINEFFKEKEVGSKNTRIVSISNFSHLIELDLVSGIFLPFDFSEPFNLILREDSVSISSSIQVQKELYLWLELILPWYYLKSIKLSTIFENYANNFLEVIGFSIEKGVAVEII